MLVHLDTNILLRISERSDPAYLTIRRALKDVSSEGATVCTAPQNLIEFWNVATRPVGTRSGLALPLPEATRRLRVLERVTEVLPETPDLYQHWRQLVMDYGISGASVHDARIVANMQIHGVRHLMTFNLRDFRRYSQVTLLDPSQPVVLA